MLWTLLVLGVASWISVKHWVWFSDGEPVSSVIRNLILAVAAVVALPLAIWRSIVAERQANTAQRSLLNDRYQKGAEMLGSEVLSVRLGGIYALLRLAQDHPKQHHIQVIELLCAFVRNPPEIKESQDKQDTDEEQSGTEEPSLREDVQAVMTAIGERGKVGLGYEKAEDFRPDLRGADLRRAYLLDANLSGAKLHEADLTRADLRGADLSNAELVVTKLSRAILAADLSGAKLLGVDLEGAILSNTDLSGAHIGVASGFSAKGLRFVFPHLTQAQLDEARADPENPPRMDDDDGLVDYKTGEPLVWRGKSPLQGGK